MLGGVGRLPGDDDVHLLPSQDHPGELLRADGRRPAAARRPVRRRAAVAARRARRVLVDDQHLGAAETGTDVGLAQAPPGRRRPQRGMVHRAGASILSQCFADATILTYSV